MAGISALSGLRKKIFAPLLGPKRQFIVSRLQFIGYLFNAENFATGIIQLEPIPERGAEVESVMQIFLLG
jgi:hypothetical protein